MYEIVETVPIVITKFTDKMHISLIVAIRIFSLHYNFWKHNKALLPLLDVILLYHSLTFRFVLGGSANAKFVNLNV